MKHIIALICAAWPLTAVQAEETTRTFPGAELHALEIRTAGGDIKVEGSDVQEVQVEINHPDWAKCEITMVQKGDTLILNAKSKSKWLWKPSCPTGFRVRSPKKLSLESFSGSGKTQVSAINGAAVLNVGSGNIQIHDIAGDLTARLGSGSLAGNTRAKEVKILSGSGSVNLEGLAGSADVKAGSGDISLSWAETPKSGEAALKTGSGDVSLTFPPETKLKTDVITGSGDIRNHIDEAASAGFRVSVKSGSGDVRIDKQSEPSRK